MPRTPWGLFRKQIMKKVVNGHLVEFTVALQNKAQFQKVITVRLAADGGRQGCTLSVGDALAHARKIATIQTEWEIEFPIAERNARNEKS
jgi:hypothetical protein